MKALVSTLLVACALAAPAAAFAQTATPADPANAPVTRAQVIDDLVRLEQAGYRPVAKDNDYPDDIQRAEAIVAQQDAQTAQHAAPANSAVGGVAMTGSSD
ncbi:DUF4148 domain-containing protein [Paraburkholderia sp. BR10937]|uniref:DUF4148 domain-containing protein n=1 Tax=Paraburkholderia sp. BR10937 TaxID=3236994 RepID=UPI0034D2C46A